MKYFILITFLIVSSLEIIYAQDWTREDSVWLKNYLEGKSEFKLNNETLKAIEEGKLIVPSWMKKNENSNIRELIKDFEDAAVRDSIKMERINPLSMPPAVFALYVLYIDKIDSLNANQTILLSESEKEKLKETLPPGNATIYVGNLGTGAPSGTIGSLDFNHALSMIFSSQYRRLHYNRKHATAHKFYYDEGAIQPSFKWTESDKRRINSEINNRKVNVRIKTSPNTFNGIDD
jgi:hypothetical protein